MEQTIESTISEGKSSMDNAIQHLKDELIKIRTGKASPSMLNGIMVSYYGNPTPLSQVANLGTADSKTLTIQAWEKSMLATIEQAIFAANLGLTPMNDGEFIRISIPPLTEERRKDLVKQAKSLGEDTKVSLRNERQKMMEFIKKEVKNGYPEDAGKKQEDAVQNLTKAFGKKTDDLIEAKEKDILTV